MLAEECTQLIWNHVGFAQEGSVGTPLGDTGAQIAQDLVRVVNSVEGT